MKRAIVYGLGVFCVRVCPSWSQSDVGMEPMLGDDPGADGADVPPIVDDEYSLREVRVPVCRWVCCVCS